jgi:hypothetical protein
MEYNLRSEEYLTEDDMTHIILTQVLTILLSFVSFLLFQFILTLWLATVEGTHIDDDIEM